MLELSNELVSDRLGRPHVIVEILGAVIEKGRCGFLRRASPYIAVGLGLLLLRNRRRRWRARMNRMEKRQEEILQTLKDIRDKKS
jgi:hypothetical protein